MIKDVVGFEGLYAVDDSGNIYSYKWGKCKMLKPAVNSRGYYLVFLSKNGNEKCFKVHRIVAQAFLSDYKEYLQVDHIDRNRLNNNISNLRMATHQENMFNRNVKGYTWRKDIKKFQAYINVNHKRKHLGHFDKEEDARAAYLKAKEVYHRIES